MAKFTFVFDEPTAAALRATAERLGKSQSLVVREAVADYAARAGRLTDAERQRMLATVDSMMRRPSSTADSDVAAELEQVKEARRDGGRRTPAA
jgi:ribbon-helix-helix CopG family protein